MRRTLEKVLDRLADFIWGPLPMDEYRVSLADKLLVFSMLAFLVIFGWLANR